MRNVNNHREAHIKQIKFRLNISDHDKKFKINQIEQFLNKGETVKVTLMLIGRQQSNPERGISFLEELKISGHKSPVSSKGRDISVMCYPA